MPSYSRRAQFTSAILTMLSIAFSPIANTIVSDAEFEDEYVDDLSLVLQSDAMAQIKDSVASSLGEK